MAGFSIDRIVRYQPAGGVEYPRALHISDPSFSRVRQLMLGIGGAMLALLLMVSIPGAVSDLLLKAYYALVGGAPTWAEFAAQARVFGNPAGMAATHLGLAAMIPVALGLVLFVHRFHPRWLHSVQPGFRWRFAFGATLIAAVIIGGIWALSRVGEAWVYQPESQFGWYLVVILLTAPLQAAGEEYLFRGYLIQAISLTAVDPRRYDNPVAEDGRRARAARWLATHYPNWAGVIGSALIFALLHRSDNVQAFLYPLAFGLLAGWLAIRTGGLEAGIAAHVVNNLITFGYAAFSGTMVATYTNRSVDWLQLVIVLVSFALFALAAIWLAKRMKLATNTPASQF
jgi:uncharacterized protein